MTDDDRPRQRRRRRATAPQGAPQDTVRTPPQAAAAEAAPTRSAPAKAAPAKAAKKPRHTASGRPKNPDRGLHDLVGGGSSQLDASRALRARDVNRPSDADLVAAERDLQLVRRNWRPQ